MTRFVRSEKTTRLVAYLSAFDKGSTIAYDELSRIVGDPVDSRSHHLRSARAILQAEHNQVWNAVAPRVGVYRLNDVEIADRLPRWWLKGARNKLNRGRDQSTVADRDKLDLDRKARLAVHSIQVELALQSLSKASARRLEKVARGSSNDLPAFNAVEWAITLMPVKPGRSTGG